MFLGRYDSESAPRNDHWSGRPTNLGKDDPVKINERHRNERELALIILLGLLFLGSTDDRMKASPERSLVDPSKRIFPKARTNAHTSFFTSAHTLKTWPRIRKKRAVVLDS